MWQRKKGERRTWKKKGGETDGEQKLERRRRDLKQNTRRDWPSHPSDPAESTRA